MSNKKTLEQMSTTEAKRAGITSLADRPNDASRYGDGGLTAAKLKERFDALPNLVREKFNKIADLLAGSDAARYITLGGEDNALGETLFDFLALFGPRGDGITDKNISDLIETLYDIPFVDANGNEVYSRTLKDIVASICARLVALKSFADGALGNIDIYVDDDGGIVYEATDRNGLGVNLTKLDPIGKGGIGDGAVGFEKLDSELGGRIVHVENFAFEAVSYNAETGVLSFKAKNGGEKRVDLPLELLVKSGYFDESERDVVLVLANGGEVRIPFDAYVEKVTEELKRIDARLPTPGEADDGRFLKAKNGRIVFSDIGGYSFPRLKPPLSAVTDSRGMAVTVENRESAFVLKNYVYVDGERVGSTEDGAAFDFSEHVDGKIWADIGVTAAGEGFIESEAVHTRWGLTNGDESGFNYAEVLGVFDQPLGAMEVYHSYYNTFVTNGYGTLTVASHINGEPVCFVSDTFTGESNIHRIAAERFIFLGGIDARGFGSEVYKVIENSFCNAGIGALYLPFVKSDLPEDEAFSYSFMNTTIDRLYSLESLPSTIVGCVTEQSSNEANGFRIINTWCSGVGWDRENEYAYKPDNTIRVTYPLDYGKDGSLGYYQRVIPDVIEGMPVNGVGKFYCYNDLYLEGVTFGDNMENINASAFRNCSRLSSVKFGKGLKVISENAFRWTGIGSLDLSACPKLEEIQGRAFSNCSKLAKVTLPESVKIVGSTAFASCSALKDIYVPWSEGEVAGAPWGATGATVHYNSEV